MPLNHLVSSEQLLEIARIFASRNEQTLAGHLLNAAKLWEHWTQNDPKPIAKSTKSEETSQNTLEREYDESWFDWERDDTEQLLVMRIPAGEKRKSKGTDYAPAAVVREVAKELAGRAERSKEGPTHFGARELAKALDLDTPQLEYRVRVVVRFFQAHGLVAKRAHRRGNRTYRVVSRDPIGDCERLMKATR